MNAERTQYVRYRMALARETLDVAKYSWDSLTDQYEAVLTRAAGME